MTLNRKMSLRQLQILIFLSAFATGIVVLPRRVAENGGIWAAAGLVILGAFFAFLVAAAAGKIAKEGDSFAAGLGQLLTRPVAWAISLVLCIVLIISAGMEMRILMLISKEVLLPLTPLWAMGLAFAVLLAYAATHGIEAHARSTEVLALVLILPAVLLLAAAIWRADFSDLNLTTKGAIVGTTRLGFIFTGLPALLLAGFYTNTDGKKLARGASRAVFFAGLAVIMVTAVTLAAFGGNIGSESWPVVSMMDMLSSPGGFMPRQEALMFTMFIATAFVLLGALTFAAASLSRDLLNLKTRRENEIYTASFAAALIFAVSLAPLDAGAVYKILDYMYKTAGLFFMLFLPVIILLAAKNLRRLALPALFILVFLTSCWDRVELEDRAFITKIEISDYTLTLRGEDLEYNATAESLDAALAEIKEQSEKQLYFGQVCTISAPPHAFDFLASLPKLNRRVLYSVKEAIKNENKPEAAP